MFRKAIKIRQRDVTDCGATCLASVAAFYRLYIPVSTIRLSAGTDRLGTNVLGMVESAEKFGFRAKSARGDVEGLQKIPIPTIAHLSLKNGLQHFVVIYKLTKRNIWLMDPADGKIHKKKLNLFLDEWTGVLILLIPSNNFIASSKKVTNLNRFWYLIKPHKNILFQALLGAILYTLLGLSLSLYVQKLIDIILVDGDIPLLRLLSIGMIVILFFQFIIANNKSILGLQTGQQIDIRLILGYYRHLLALPQSFFDTMRTGELLSRINDAVKIRLFINDVALSLVVNFFIILFSVSMFFFYYWKLAVIILIIIPIYALLYFISNSINKRWQRKLMEESAELETQLVESIDSAATIKRFGLEDFTGIKMENKFIRLMKSIYSSSLYGIYINNTTDFATKLVTVLLLWIGSYFVIQHELSPGELLSFYALIGYFTSPVASLISANKMLQEAMIASDRLFEIIDLEKEPTLSNSIILSKENIGDIQFLNISFRYGSRTKVFEKLNLVIKKGVSTAIVGESGSGKSTLLSLIQNLYPLNDGIITIGGIDIRHVDNLSLRKVVSVVPQKIDLFAGTIIDNIAIGDYEPDLRRIIFFCQLLGVSDFIEKLPEGYNSILHEQGINLSGGQRQRLAIARALYRNPEILILDEATSSLDPTSEQKVLDTLNWFKSQGKTIIIIAHRLSTIKHCDKILVLHNGALVEQGSHNELLLNNGHYTKLWNYNSSALA